MVAMKGHEEGDKRCYYKLSHELCLEQNLMGNLKSYQGWRGDGKVSRN